MDLGPGLAKLLHRLKLDEEALRYVGRILAAFKENEQRAYGESTESSTQLRTSSAHQPLIEPLSKRELEILRLLALHLSNQEIADKLYISTGTVKSHGKNIYGKLGVGSRREAVAKAMGLGILREG